MALMASFSLEFMKDSIAQMKHTKGNLTFTKKDQELAYISHLKASFISENGQKIAIMVKVFISILIIKGMKDYQRKEHVKEKGHFSTMMEEFIRDNG